MKADKTGTVAKAAKRKKKKPHQQGREQQIAIFVAEYSAHANGKKAAIAAGFSQVRAKVTASELLCLPMVQEKLRQLQDEKARAAGISAEAILRMHWQMANADPNEIVQTLRVSCRYCHGAGNRFQRTPAEMERYRAKWDKELAAKAKLNGRRVEEMEDEFDPQGGIGYQPFLDPNPKCPECFGRGELRIEIQDSTKLSPAARMLYAGGEKTKDGFKVRMHSQPEAVRDSGKAIGLYRTGVDVRNKSPAARQPEEVILGAWLAANAKETVDIGPGPSKGKPPSGK